MQEILNRPAKLLTQAQREAYFTDGFVGVEGLVDARWLERLNQVTNEFIEISKDNLKYKFAEIDNGRIFTDYVENVAIINKNQILDHVSYLSLIHI